MTPFVIAAYIIVTVLVLFLTDLCLRNAVQNRESRRKLHRILLPVYLLLQLMVPLGTYLPRSRTKYLIQGAGNVWF